MPEKNNVEHKIKRENAKEVHLKIGVNDDAVLMDLGTEVSWLGFTAEEAISVAEMLITNAQTIIDKRTQTDADSTR